MICKRAPRLLLLRNLERNMHVLVQHKFASRSVKTQSPLELEVKIGMSPEIELGNKTKQAVFDERDRRRRRRRDGSI